ncbi:MAG: AbrB/MazE/SpoVT family DNA-binding domain-containing protein [Bacillota bacterium]|nr:AbrB/MazE/SpoVT family DNA-binding domain-containing protein [Bacillota bacterium]
MLIELRSRSQITIPAEIIKSLGLTEGDRFEVKEKDGGIFLCPVVVYPKEKMKQIALILKETEEEGYKSKAYDNVEKMFEDIGINLDEV